LTTVHRANAAHGQPVYRFLKEECKAEYIQLIPILERESQNGIPVGSGVTDCSVAPEDYGKFLIDIFDEWVRRDVAKVYVQMFDLALSNWYGEPSPVCVFAPTCGTALVLEHNGDLYSCSSKQKRPTPMAKITWSRTRKC
jgi:uncharacterized protein